jgi:hypothetical protein
MNNVSVIMARGVEGCGVTKYTVEQVKWLRKKGYNVKVYAAKDKNYSRKNAHDLGEFDWFKFAHDEPVNKMIEECNNSDVVMINSLPSKDNGRGKGSGAEAVANWIRSLNEIKKPKVLIQHDHTVYSIRRNGALNESIDASDIIFAHATTNDFSQHVREHTGSGGLASFLGDDTKKIFPFQPGIDFDGTRAQYWKPIEEQDPMHHKWIGRTTSWKGYKLMFDWHNANAANEGWLTTMEGIEKSPAWLGFKELSDFYDELANQPDDVDLASRYGDKASVFSTFINDELMHRMSRVGFGYQLSILKPKYIERSIEYTHQEVVAAGTVPVFRREYGEVCLHRTQSKPLTECINNGTLWLHADGTGNDETLEKMRKLANDPVMRDEYREMAYEFYKDHQDADDTFQDLMNTIKENL